MEHLSSDELGAFLANALTDADRTAVERHLVGCAECRSDLIEAQRAVASHTSDHRFHRQRWIVVAGLAAAAVLVVAIWPRNATRNSLPVERNAPAISARSAVTIISPSVNGELDETNPAFTWNKDDGSSYRITVTDDGGGPLWTESTNDTSVVLPPTTQLARGARFFWYVDALRPDGRSITSGINAFSTPR